MKKFIIGRSPLTTLAGYILAVLIVVRDLAGTGAHHWQDYLLPAAIALFGRLAADENSPPPPPPPLAFPQADDSPASQPERFFRRGREHSHQRSRDGRFAPSIV